ncbi:hypothetical protein K438DRAFT_2155311 [Mycena galopus ATCC 62051]|nr:hypothetical protein K438DRAFT_2155311 [Mycena galopus ATCC 62051]
MLGGSLRCLVGVCIPWPLFPVLLAPFCFAATGAADGIRFPAHLSFPNSSVFAYACSSLDLSWFLPSTYILASDRSSADRPWVTRNSNPLQELQGSPTLEFIVHDVRFVRFRETELAQFLPPPPGGRQVIMTAPPVTFDAAPPLSQTCPPTPIDLTLGMERIYPVYAPPWIDLLPVTTIIPTKENATAVLQDLLSDSALASATWFTEVVIC